MQKFLKLGMVLPAVEMSAGLSKEILMGKLRGI